MLPVAEPFVYLAARVANGLSGGDVGPGQLAPECNDFARRKGMRGRAQYRVDMFCESRLESMLACQIGQRGAGLP